MCSFFCEDGWNLPSEVVINDSIRINPGLLDKPLCGNSQKMVASLCVGIFEKERSNPLIWTSVMESDYHPDNFSFLVEGKMKLKKC